MNNALAEPLELPNGQVVPNRLLKSAMSEGLGTGANRVSTQLVTLYDRWARGGIGLLVTGNVMVDRAALGEPGNVALEDDRDLDLLKRWAVASKSHGALVYMQLNHPGRQAPKFINERAFAPSAVPMSADFAPYFPPPSPLTPAQIHELIERFATSAHLAEQAGFDGVQIHGAHGYLVSQFLSPLTNQRTDDWGGTPENRRRFPLEIVRAIRAVTSPGFGVAIKINSADFQRGGFTEEESLQSIEALGAEGLAFVEISGGTYEAPAMIGLKASTVQREAYFLDFAERCRSVLSTPLAVTGGFRSSPAMAEAVVSGAVDLVGMARPLAVRPDFPAELLADPEARAETPPRRTGFKMVDRLGMLETIYYERQLHRMGHGQEPRADESPLLALLAHSWNAGLSGLKVRRGR